MLNVTDWSRHQPPQPVKLEPSVENAVRVLKALAEFGFGSLALTETDFIEPEQVIQLGYPPSRIDLLTSADGVEFSACYPQRLVAVIDEVPINFIDLENLRKNKQATGRAQDIADLEALK